MPNTSLPSHHYLFAHILRGLAAVIVFLGAHLMGNFWMNPSAVCQLLGLKPCFTPQSMPVAVAWLNDTGWFRYNHFGVAIFFLISGFVIPFSLLNYNRRQFLVARFFRIYPTYCVAFTFALIALISFHHGILWFSLSDILAQMTLTRDLFWVPSLDAVSWTLEIEIKFYLICALITGILVRGQIGRLLLFILGFGLLEVAFGRTQLGPFMDLGEWTFNPPWYGIAHALAISMVYIVYMLMGSCFNWHSRKLISTPQLFCLLIILFPWFALLWYQCDFQPLFFPGIFNYFLALILFSLAYFFRHKIKPIRALIWLGNISYPLYAVHLITSYVVLYWFIYIKHIPASLALPVAIILAVVLAIILHRTVELPSNNFGKKLAKQIGNRKQPASSYTSTREE